jgi:putative protease
MLELLAPAGSPESVRAAVRNGADAVYMGFGNFNARRNAKNFTEEEFSKLTEYCRIRGVKVYLTLNTLVSDREFSAALEQLIKAVQMGVDAVIVQDLGLLRAVRKAIPDLPIYASTQMSVHNLDGVKKLAELGASRVVLARELSREEIAYICHNSPIEIEVFCHGALCMSYSGQCYMSSVIGRRSGNRGLCAQPCRLNYGLGPKANDFPLSLKDLCLIEHIKDLEKCGVSCLKIEGRMRRPEYVAIVTRIYKKAITEGGGPTREDIRELELAFSRQGFTDGYFISSKGRSMFGIREDTDNRELDIFAKAKREYTSGDAERVPVRFYCIARVGEPLRIGVEDDRGNRLTALGSIPEPSLTRSLTEEDLKTQLSKTGGTPYFAQEVNCLVDEGLYLPVSEINEHRRNLLDALTEMRAEPPSRRFFDYQYSPLYANSDLPPELTISVASAQQLTPELAQFRPSVLYVPLEELYLNLSRMEPFEENGVTKVAVALPPVIHDDERRDILRMLEKVKAAGVSEALVGNLGQIDLIKSFGFLLRGDTGLNIFNSESLHALRELGFISSALSFELRLAQIRDISKCIDTEIITYGRLPLMITENCTLKSSTNACACDNFPLLRDRRGALFPVMKLFGCRNLVLNSEKIFLADRFEHYSSIGLWAQRLSFTTENPKECVQIAARYLGLGNYEIPSRTTGLYYRGVE